VHSAGSAGFRYWTAAESLRRSPAFWAASGAKAWHRDVGASLPVRLDDGVDLNAYYARTDFPAEDIKQGLSFFHDTVRDVTSGRNVTVFSGESPDVVAHELGHAVLDTLKPVLFEIASIEAAAFHESFGDMSAILTALQLPTVRQAVLEETDGNLRRNSSVSRVAEQLGFAIRQRSPSAVDRDSLRNARQHVPLRGSAHTAGFRSGLATHARAAQSVACLHRRLPRSARRHGAHAGGVAGERRRGTGNRRHGPPARACRRGRLGQFEVLPVGRRADRAGRRYPLRRQVRGGADVGLRAPQPDAGGLARRAGRLGVGSARAAAAAARFSATSGGRRVARAAGGDRAVRIAIDGGSLGLGMKTLYVCAPSVDDAGVGPATMMAGMAARDTTSSQRSTELHAFCEALIVRGRVSMGSTKQAKRGLVAALSKTRKHATHYLAPAANGAAELKRIAFECC
jgi:hypothetical protein